MNIDALGLPLSRKQIDFIAHSDQRISLTSGSIRAGKTIAQLLRWLIYTAEAPETGELCIVGKTTNTVASNVFGPLTDPTLFGDLTRYVHYTRGAPTATILGRPVRVVGANDVRSEERIRGMTCAGALVDEATLIPREFFVQLLGRMSVPGAQLFATTNPGAPGHYLRKEFMLNPELDLRHWKFTLDDNPSLDPAYVASIKAEFSGVFYKRFIEGAWTTAEGAVFDQWDEDRHVIDVLPTIREWIAVGIDYGTINPLHAVLLGLGMDRKLYVVSEYRYDSRKTGQQLTDAEYSERLRSWLVNVPIPHSSAKGVRPRYTIVDPSAASFKAQLHRDGLQVTDGNNAVMDGLRELSSLLATDQLLVHRSCTGLIEELPGYAWDEKVALLGEDRPIKADDHGVDALRYAVHTTRRLWRSELRAA